eukprot:766038-Hanusia_phi.AAC.1
MNDNKKDSFLCAIPGIADAVGDAMEAFRLLPCVKNSQDLGLTCALKEQEVELRRESTAGLMAPPVFLYHPPLSPSPSLPRSLLSPPLSPLSPLSPSLPSPPNPFSPS